MPRGLFELGEYWIDRVDGSTNLYRFWYDRKRGDIRRRSLKTSDLGAAKLKLATIVGTGKKDDTRSSDDVMLVAALTHYFTTHSDRLPSAKAARRAGKLIMDFMTGPAGFKANVKVAVFTKAMQQAFCEWSTTEHGHSVKYMSRNLSVVSAAFQHAASDVLTKGPDGELREVRLLSAAPEVYYEPKWISKVTDLPEGGPREYVPTYEDLASLLDYPAGEMVQRYDILALNTWARPEAILDLRLAKQVHFEHGLVELNPPGRRQNKKRRPLIRLTQNLRAWLEAWGDDAPLCRPVLDEKGRIVEWEPIAGIKAQFMRRTFAWMLGRSGLTEEAIKDLEREKRQGRPEAFWRAIEAAEAAGIRRITQVTYRHFMATRIRGLEEIKVDREQREMWLGHVEGDTTSWYESHDPEYLRACADGTDLIISKLDAFTRRPLVPASLKARMAAAGFKVVE